MRQPRPCPPLEPEAELVYRLALQGEYPRFQGRPDWAERTKALMGEILTTQKAWERVLAAVNRKAVELFGAAAGRSAATHMFAGSPDATAKAEAIAAWLSNHAEMKTHGRKLSRDLLEERGLRIERLEDDQTLQDAVLSVYHAVAHTLSTTPSCKIIENHMGRCYVRMAGFAQAVMVQQPKTTVPLKTA